MRVLERLEELYAIGDRIGYSPEEQQAHDLAAAWFVDAGLELEVDDGGNLIGRVPGAGREVWTGSHLDTVPAGGRFDGALGVVAGLEAVERLGLPGLGVVVFRDEERGCAGSRFRIRSARAARRLRRAAHRAGTSPGRAGRTARSRARHRRLRAGRAHGGWPRRARGHDADGPPGGRARRCGPEGARDPRRGTRDPRRGRDRRPARGRARRRERHPLLRHLQRRRARAGRRAARPPRGGDRIRAHPPRRARRDGRGRLHGGPRRLSTSWASRSSSSRRARGTTPGSSRRPACRAR